MEEDYNAVLMYSLSVIPVIQGYNIESFDVLFQKLIIGNSFRSVNNPLDAIKNDAMRLVLDSLQACTVVCVSPAVMLVSKRRMLCKRVMMRMELIIP